MSILSKSGSTTNTPSFHDLKKQASFFFKEKIKTARLALTDVTPAELLTEEAVTGNPDARTLTSISRAAFELEDYWRIVAILHKRFLKFEKKNWRVSYNCLIIVEHLLTHGPESVADEFQGDRDVITQMGTFQFVDEKGFNWGIAVRRKSDRILNFLDKGLLLKEERERARKLTREIQGFGSFSLRSQSPGILAEPSSSIGKYGKCNSNFNRHENHGFEETPGIEISPETGESEKENLVPIPNREEAVIEEFKDGIWTYDSHPFNDVEIHHTSVSLLSG